MQNGAAALIGAAAMLVAGWALLPSKGAEDAPGRFQLVSLSSGTMARLDTRTGDVTGCVVIPDGWPHVWCDRTLDDARRLAQAWHLTMSGAE